MRESEVKKEIIEFFHNNKDKYLSGEDISERFGFSRAGVWKYIKKLREEGYIFEAVPRRGYCLKEEPDKLLPHAVSSGLKTKIIGKDSIYYFDNINSTNDKAYELADAGAAEGTLVIAEAQSEGKGRRGRKWLSPRGGGIYMSVILRPELELNELPAITLTAGVALSRSIKELCGLVPSIKWPNDIFINGKKVSGILTEIKADPDAVDFLVLGLGVNVNTPIRCLPEGAASLKAILSVKVDRIALVKSILENLEKYYNIFSDKGFSGIRKECLAFSSTLGAKIAIDMQGTVIRGLGKDIDKSGALIVETTDGEIKRFFSGDVTLLK